MKSRVKKSSQRPAAIGALTLTWTFAIVCLAVSERTAKKERKRAQKIWNTCNSIRATLKFTTIEHFAGCGGSSYCWPTPTPRRVVPPFSLLFSSSLLCLCHRMGKARVNCLLMQLKLPRLTHFSGDCRTSSSCRCRCRWGNLSTQSSMSAWRRQRL